MATDRENVKIEIIIAGEQILLTVPFSKQNSVRRCESDINALYSEWRAKFPRKSPSELLAMIAYQYASFFQELSDRYDAVSDALSDTSRRLDDLIKTDKDNNKDNDSFRENSFPDPL